MILLCTCYLLPTAHASTRQRQPFLTLILSSRFVPGKAWLPPRCKTALVPAYGIGQRQREYMRLRSFLPSTDWPTGCALGASHGSERSVGRGPRDSTSTCHFFDKTGVALLSLCSIRLARRGTGCCSAGSLPHIGPRCSRMQSRNTYVLRLGVRLLAAVRFGQRGVCWRRGTIHDISDEHVYILQTTTGLPERDMILTICCSKEGPSQRCLSSISRG